MVKVRLPWCRMLCRVPTLCDWDTGQMLPPMVGSEAETLAEILAEVSRKECSFALDLASKGLQSVVSWRICQCVCSVSVKAKAFSLFFSFLLTLSFALTPLLFLPEYILKTVLQCSLLQDYSVLY